MQVPHAATLPRIVWVFDAKHHWWPGKITQYPPKDNVAKVSRFGNVKPKSIVLECSESNILPFEHVSKESLQQQGLQSQFSKAFDTALREAIEAQLKDDDGLPSLDDIINHFSSAPSTSIETARKDTAIRQRPPVRPDMTYMPDSSLSIPGELILAHWERLYYPARIISFNEKSNKYKVEYATGNSLSIERKKFFTRYEKGFQTCQLGDLAAPTIEGYEDKELELQMRLHFFTDVLLPETITRLTMRRYNLSYAEADLRVLEGTRDGATDTWWVDDVLAARESFLYARSLQ
ncbi:hypothetical protein BGZ68_008108 [Mortierella alpina]|nr:hypothetical protein BGZ68_008108 [Mortierella alpina]